MAASNNRAIGFIVSPTEGGRGERRKKEGERDRQEDTGFFFLEVPSESLLNFVG
jgi:hypothetical protein